jgi:hypothetical protein
MAVAGLYRKASVAASLVVGLAQRRSVVENPEAAAVRGDDQVVAVDHQVAHRDRRQIQLQGLPVVAIVEGNRDTELGCRVEQSLARRIFANVVHVRRLAEAVGG